MAATFDPPGRALVEALAELDRTECGDRVVRFWSRTVLDRAEALAKAFAPALRFARVAERAGRRGYVFFLYSDVGRFRPEAFRGAFLAAEKRGAFAGRPIETAGDRVLLREAALAFGDGDAFDLAFAQMPKVAAFLDLLHNTIGYAETAELIAPAIADGPADVAAFAEAERRLRNAFNAWLRPHLESQHRRNQAKIIQALLAADGRLSPEKIDDQAVFDIWAARAAHWRAEVDAAHAAADQTAVEEAMRRISKAARDEGFRRFASAARLTFLYRRALERRRTERAMEEARTTDASEDVGGSPLERLLSDDVVEAGDGWSSPLAVLDAPPASSIRWMKGGQRRRLQRFLGAAPDRAGDDEDETEVETDASEDAGVERPISPEHWRTILRLDVYGAAQERMTNALRAGADPARALAECVEGIEADALEASAAAHREIAAHARLSALALLARLIEAGKPEALALLSIFVDGPTYAALAARVRKGLRPQLSVVGADASGSLAAIVALEDAPELEEVLKEARRATRSVNRAGFRRGDLDDAALADGVRVGLDAFAALVREAESIAARMPDGALRDATAAETDAFRAVFEDLFRAL